MGWAFPVCKLAQKPWTASEHSNTFHCMSWSKQEKDQQYIQYAYATECQNHKGPNFHLVSANLLLSELPTHSSCQNMQLGHVHAKRYPNNPCMQEMSLHCQPQWNHIMHPKWITHLAAFFSLGTPISKCCNNSWSSFSWHSSKATSSLEGLPVAQKGYSTCCMDRTWKKQITSPTTANMMHDNNKKQLQWQAIKSNCIHCNITRYPSWSKGPGSGTINPWLSASRSMPDRSASVYRLFRLTIHTTKWSVFAWKKSMQVWVKKHAHHSSCKWSRFFPTQSTLECVSESDCVKITIAVSSMKHRSHCKRHVNQISISFTPQKDHSFVDQAPRYWNMFWQTKKQT